VRSRQVAFCTNLVSQSAAETADGFSDLQSVSPNALFNYLFGFMIISVVITKLLSASGGQQSSQAHSSATGTSKNPALTKLNFHFLSVFWLFKMADWLQGPYFYEVYASKVFGGQPARGDVIAQLFLTGFASTALFGPIIGRMVDQYGRKRGCLAFVVLYAIGSCSVCSNNVFILFLGRIASGMGTALLFSAPEAWFVSEFENGGYMENLLSSSFGLAYFGDSLVAISAGQLAGGVASQSGPTAPFQLSLIFLGAASVIITCAWKENFGRTAASSNSPSLKDAWSVMCKDKNILLLGIVQSFFEGAMYIFVLQWPPSMMGVVPSDISVPFGKVFSCFMVCCMLGSSVFSILSKKFNVETTTVFMLAVATSAMAIAVAGVGSSLGALVGAFFLFEICVGLYFPSIGTLRSKYVPSSHRSMIVNLYQVPLNLLVSIVFLSIQQLGIRGALCCATAALCVAFAAAAGLFMSQARSKP